MELQIIPETTLKGKGMTEDKFFHRPAITDTLCFKHKRIHSVPNEPQVYKMYWPITVYGNATELCL